MRLKITPYELLAQWRFGGRLPDLIYYKDKTYTNVHELFYEVFKDNHNDLGSFVHINTLEIDYPILSDVERQIIRDDCNLFIEWGGNLTYIIKCVELTHDCHAYRTRLCYIDTHLPETYEHKYELHLTDLDSLLPNAQYNLDSLMKAQPTQADLGKLRSIYNPFVQSIKRISDGTELVMYDEDDNYYGSKQLKPDELSCLQLNRPYYYEDFMR